MTLPLPKEPTSAQAQTSLSGSHVLTPEQRRDPNYFPTLSIAIPLGVQHILAMFVSNVTPAIIVAGAAGFGYGSDDPSDMLYMIQMQYLYNMAYNTVCAPRALKHLMDQTEMLHNRAMTLGMVETARGWMLSSETKRYQDTFKALLYVAKNYIEIRFETNIFGSKMTSKHKAFNSHART